MNSFSLVILCLVGSMSALIGENETKQPNLIGIIEVILNDPEFASLKPQQQFSVVIYEMLETYLRRHQYDKRNNAHQIEQPK